ncbi:DNA methyltransferase [Brachybacterium alimentarium]|uniref:DNA methyltransferase n=1 Tax=Brachybacterium alimentarium TaxID=47845 RepID=UPI003FD099CF
MPTIHNGDCIETMNAMPPESVDAIVTDPPYGLGFMGKKWDGLPPSLEWAEACYRVLKPGGHIAAFGGTRTWHRLAVAIEDAGFEMRDSLAWLYGSGFPKSHDVGKAIDKRPGASQHPEFGTAIRAAMTAKGYTNTFDVAEVVLGKRTGAVANWIKYQFPEARWWPALRDLLDMDEARWGPVIAEAERTKVGQRNGTDLEYAPGEGRRRDATVLDITAPATPEAVQWDGWGTALKPAFEPIVLARKPLAEKTVARNVLAHGTGAINVDACRIGTDEDTSRAPSVVQDTSAPFGTGIAMGGRGHSSGRWPANVLLDQHAAAWVDEQSGVQKDGVAVNRNRDPEADKQAAIYGTYKNGNRPDITYGGGGGASRFFYSIREDISCQIPDPASTAGSLSSPPSASAGSAAGHAATSASPGIVSEARSASTNDTGTGSRRSGASGTPPIGTTGSECSPESRHARPTPTPSHASNVELSEPTDITTTTTSPSISGGSAESATSSTTPASDLGVLPGGESGSRFMYSAKAPKSERPNVDGVQHPTVKPLAIMRWLIRLVTPPGGTVLDPFAGSGTTIEAALIEGFDPVGIEMEPDYLPLIQHRIDRQSATLTA